jgi:hypothetical protein
VSFDARNTREVLLGTGIECPSATTYLKGMVEHVRLAQASRAQGRKTKRNPHFEEMEDPLD